MHETNTAAVKVVYGWRVPAGRRESFAAWLEGLAANASAAAGYEGASVFSAHEDWLLLLRFADAAALAAWQAAAGTQAQLAAAAPLAHGGWPAQQRTGLETWFALPGSPAGAAPPRWKMALTTWCALLPQVVLLGAILPASVPYPLRTLLGTLIPVATLTWVVMPLLTRWLARWLYPGTAP